MKSPKKETKKVGKSKKGGTVELSPLAAAGILYAIGHYGKKANRGRKVRGGAEEVVATTPGGATPVIYTGKPSVPTEVKPAVPGSTMPAGSIIPETVRHENPATAVMVGSASKSPLVTGGLLNNDIGATSASRPASVNTTGGLLQAGGGKKRKARKQKGGNDSIASRPPELMPVSTSPATPLPPVPSMASQSCGHIGASIPPGTSSGGKLGLSMVVPGAVGGVSGQEVPSQFGGAKKGRKGKKSTKGKKRGGAEDDYDSVDGGSSAEQEIGGYLGGAKNKGRKGTKGKKDKKRGGVDQDEYRDDEAESLIEDTRNMTDNVTFYYIKDLIMSTNAGSRSIGMTKKDINNIIKLIQEDNSGDVINFIDADGNDLLHYANLRGFEDIAKAIEAKKNELKESESKGGAKKDKKKSKGKKRGGNEGCAAQYGGEDQVMGVAGGVNQPIEPELVGGAKKGRKAKKDKKRGGGGAEVEAFNAVPNPGAPLGGFDTLLVDLKKQVGGRYKNKGGAFKLYARELSALSKKLQKLV